MMMIRAIYICAIFMFSVGAANAQVEDNIAKAFQFYLEKDYAKAASIIDEVVESKKGSESERAWHVRAFIYKDMYLKGTESVDLLKAREIAVQSFMESMRLDVNQNLLDQNKKALRLLASKYYNDAARVISTRDASVLDSAYIYFDRYKSIHQKIEPDTNLVEKDIEFYLAMSTSHRHIYENDREKNENHFDLSKKMLKKVLELDPENFKANYSLAVSYYNNGIYSLQTLPDAAIFDIVTIEAESMRSIEVALPFMMKAYEADPEKIEAVRGLRIINFNLHREDEAKQFEEEENRLKNTNRVD